MLTIDASRTAKLLQFTGLVPVLRDAFAAADAIAAPDRHQHPLHQERESTLLLMPAWNDEFVGVKLVTVFLRNNELGRRTLGSSYLLCDAVTGEQLALIDGPELTRRRTVAASALAASFLARPDAETLLVIGTGAIGSLLTDAFRAVRDIRRVLVHSRTAGSAERLVEELSARGLTVERAHDLPAAAARADIISCATTSSTPVVCGDWIAAGTHVDLIGGFTPRMREADDELVETASVFIDSPTARAEAGDIIQPVNAGVLADRDILADLADLCSGAHHGRTSAEETTMFKSVGTGLEDLAAATHIYRSAGLS